MKMDANFLAGKSVLAAKLGGLVSEVQSCKALELDLLAVWL